MFYERNLSSRSRKYFDQPLCHPVRSNQRECSRHFALCEFAAFSAKDSPFLFYYLPAISQIIYFTCSAMGFNRRKRFLRSPISATTLVLWRWYARISRPIRTSSDVSHVNHTCLHSTKGNTWIAVWWMFQYIAVILFFLWNADISSEMSEEEKSRRDTIRIHESLKVSFADTCLL